MQFNTEANDLALTGGKTICVLATSPQNMRPRQAVEKNETN